MGKVLPFVSRKGLAWQRLARQLSEEFIQSPSSAALWQDWLVWSQSAGQLELVNVKWFTKNDQ